MREWNEFKERVGMLIDGVIVLLLLPTIIFVIAMWGKFLWKVYEFVWD